MFQTFYRNVFKVWEACILLEFIVNSCVGIGSNVSYIWQQFSFRNLDKNVYCIVLKMCHRVFFHAFHFDLLNCVFTCYLRTKTKLLYKQFSYVSNALNENGKSFEHWKFTTIPHNKKIIIFPYIQQYRRVPIHSIHKYFQFIYTYNLHKSLVYTTTIICIYLSVYII